MRKITRKRERKRATPFCVNKRERKRWGENKKE